MIHTAPSFTKDGRYLIFHDDDNPQYVISDAHTYIIDTVAHKLHIKCAGIPISLSTDNEILIIQAVSKKETTRNFIFWRLNTAEQIPPDNVDSTLFNNYQQLFFKRFDSGKFTKQIEHLVINSNDLVFENIFDSEQEIVFSIDNLEDAIESTGGIIEHRGILKTLHTPIIALSGVWSSQWADYVFGGAWLLNVDDKQTVLFVNTVEYAPIQINHTVHTSKIVFIVGNSVILFDINTGSETIFWEGASPSLRDGWVNPPVIIDASLHPKNSSRIVLGKTDSWQFADRVDEECIIHEPHPIEGTLKRIAYHPSGEQICVITDVDVQVFSANSEKLICKIPLSKSKI